MNECECQEGGCRGPADDPFQCGGPVCCEGDSLCEDCEEGDHL